VKNEKSGRLLTANGTMEGYTELDMNANISILQRLFFL